MFCIGLTEEKKDHFTNCFPTLSFVGHIYQLRLIFKLMHIYKFQKFIFIIYAVLQVAKLSKKSKETPNMNI